MSFRVLHSEGKARLGVLSTAHGDVPTPAFMPVGTRGAVKGVGPHELEAAGASIMLANLYHLSLRPGIEVIEGVGGLHSFCGWPGPILTDSGGYQVFSLSGQRRIDAEGVTFRSHLDGSPVRLTPATVVDMQERMGVDVAMVLDECSPWPVDEEEASAALRRTTNWARLARESWREGPTELFGIVQGSFYPRLRESALEQTVALDFAGYAVGGISVGEERSLGRATVELVAPLLPADKPRYLMGVGTPADLVHGIRWGVDLFDCVMPARHARHGVLFTREGLLRIKNATFSTDERPIDARCSCPACVRLSRAFLRHLICSGEITGQVLATLHNLRFYLDFVADLRQALASGSFEDSAAEIARYYLEAEAKTD